MKQILFFVIFLPSFCFSQETDSLELNQSNKLDSIEIVKKREVKTKVIDDVVITGTIKPISRSKSPVAVEIYSQKFFQKNPTPNIFEAIAMVNGVKPQLNCSVCNTGDIHINGLEGPYTMILIDGMPIVSSLSTVYGLSGIPNSLIDRIEVVKGPASSLYGSEAMGGVINIITKNALTAPKLTCQQNLISGRI
jgi:outer membrane receptor for ferrienterochelin and colicins